ncbi:MAG: dTMP kinase [Bacilli bacterium]|jgi:dTMP kinase|nr:dTMP kinase [Bacilli bacterium]
MFITMEGGEGSGKSTAIKEIVAELRKEGHEVVLTREPGGTPISEEIRDIILDKKNTAMDPKTEALLYAASRRQHIVEKILPALQAGKTVICDRYLDSSLAYQGGARGIGIEKVYEMNQFATEGLLPDLTILFDIEPKEGLKRIADNAGREVNRLDIERLPFHEKVRASFHELAKRFPSRYVIIDASKGKKEVLEEAFRAIKDRMG